MLEWLSSLAYWERKRAGAQMETLARGVAGTLSLCSSSVMPPLQDVTPEAVYQQALGGCS